MAAAFKTQHFLTTNSATYTGHTAVSSLDSAVVLHNGNVKASHGIDSSSREADDLSLGLELTAVGTVTLHREAGGYSTATPVAGTIWECLAGATDPNGFVVRSRNVFTGTPNTFTAQSLDSTPTDADQCIPIITGILCDDTGNSVDKLTGCAWIDSSGDLNFRCGGSASDTVTAYITVIEFGSNWTVRHGKADAQTGDTGTITLTASSDGSGSGVGHAFSETMFFPQLAADGDKIANLSAIYEEGSSTDEIDWTFASGHDSTDYHVVHAASHSDLSRAHYTEPSDSTGPIAVDISGQGLSDTSSVIAVLTGSANLTGQSYPRGMAAVDITSASNINIERNYFTPNSDLSLYVYDLSGIEISGVSAEVGQASETDTAQSVTVEVGQVVAVGQGAETDTAFSVTALTEAIVALGIATEADTAQGITAAFPAGTVVGQATDTHTAFGVTIVQPIAVAVGLASEADEAQGIEPVLPAFGAVGISVELSTALSVTPIQTIPYGSWFGDEAVTGGFSAEAAVDATWTPDDSVTGTWSE